MGKHAVHRSPGMVSSGSENRIVDPPNVNIPMDLQAGPWQGLVSEAAATVPHGDISFHATDFADES